MLFFMAVGGLGGWAILRRVEAPDLPRGAFVVFMLLVSVASLAWVAMLARTSRAGFPMPLAYARPVQTRLLVAVPMAFLALVCAATYVVPAMALRLAFAAPFPVVPVAVLLAAGAALFSACNWFTRNNVARFGISIILLGALGPALRWIHSWTPQAAGGQFPPPLTVDSVQLDAADYGAIALAVAVAYVFTVRGVERQRHGDGEAVRGHGGLAAADRIATRGVVEQIRDLAMAALRLRCPTSSPLAAELWIETTARGLPVLAIGALLALAMPAMFAIGNASKWIGSLAFVGVAVVLPFFAGISASFWNRQPSLRAPMSAFEAVRPLPTAWLAAVQIGVAVVAIGAAWALMAASAWWSLPLYADVVDDQALKGAVAGALAASPLTTLVAWTYAVLVGFSSAVALLAGLRALTVLCGMRLWLAIVALLAYLWLVMVAIIVKWVSTAAIGVHLWAFAIAIPLSTLWLLVRAVADRSLLPPHAVVLGVAWALFAGAWVFLTDGGAALGAFPPPLAAALLAALLLPLTFGTLAVWSFGRIRHA
jgi:hypothetical protein